MSYKQALTLGGGALSGAFLLMLGYKYTIFYGKRASKQLVDTGHRAIKFNKVYGVREEIYREGWHLLVPWFERPIIYDVKTHPTVIKSMTGSKGKTLF